MKLVLLSVIIQHPFSSLFVQIVSKTALLLAFFLVLPVILLILYDLSLYITRVINLHSLYTFLVRSILKMKESNKDKMKLEKLNSVRHASGRISIRRTVQRCEQFIYENSLTH